VRESGPGRHGNHGWKDTDVAVRLRGEAQPGGLLRAHYTARMTGSEPHIIRASALVAEPWRNGLGITREVARSPQDAAHWDWRVSIADVEATAPFSAFPGIDRELVLLEGGGLRLAFDDGRTEVLDAPGMAARFAGEAGLTGEPVDGATRDFNVMWRRDRLEALVIARPLVGSMLMVIAPGEDWLLHVASGQAQLLDEELLLERGDTALWRCEPQGRHSRIAGAGLALLVRLRERKRDA